MRITMLMGSVCAIVWPFPADAQMFDQEAFDAPVKTANVIIAGGNCPPHLVKSIKTMLVKAAKQTFPSAEVRFSDKKQGNTVFLRASLACQNAAIAVFVDNWRVSGWSSERTRGYRYGNPYVSSVCMSDKSKLQAMEPCFLLETRVLRGE